MRRLNHGPVLMGAGLVLATLVGLSVIGALAGEEKPPVTAASAVSPTTPDVALGAQVSGRATVSPQPSSVPFEGLSGVCASTLLELAEVGVRMLTRVEDPPVGCEGVEFPRLVAAFSDAVEFRCIHAVMDGSLEAGTAHGCDGLREGHVRALVGSYGPHASESPSPSTGASSSSPPAPSMTPEPSGVAS